MSDRSSETVYMAFWRAKNRIVAIRIVKLPDGAVRSDLDSTWVTECHSLFRVRVYEVLRKENELWVRC